MSAERRRLTLALLLSLLIHTLLLSLTFGGQRFGLPGFAFPWRERRIEAPDLRVVLVPARVTAAEPARPLVKEPLPQASIEKAVASAPAQAVEVIVPKDKDRDKAEPTATAPAEPVPDIATAAVPAPAPLRTEASSDAAPVPIPVPEVIAVERSPEPTFVVPPPPPAPAPVIAVAPSAPIATGPETVMPAPRDVVEVAQKQAVEVAKPDPPEREVQTQRQAEQLEAARVEASQREAARQEAARAEVARLEAARLEIQREKAARLAAAQVESQRQEVARQEAARVEAARVQVARLEAARRETDPQEAVRQAATQKEAARIQEEKDEDTRRDARRQAMGRVLNEEAARREAASRLPLSFSTARRARLWGRSDPNAELVQYAEAWALKIQFNTSVDTVREVAKRAHTNPMVSVAIRSDGSVESVTFAVSSGVAEVDEAIRRIVQSHVPYQAFPPGLAGEFDVIDVRRTWHFDVAIRLH